MAKTLNVGDEIDNPFYTISTDVKNQHYVWRSYLAPWIQSHKIWCRRGNAIFNIKPEKIAKYEYFYEIESLSQGELKIVNGFLDQIDPKRTTHLPQVIQMYLRAAKGNDFVRKNAIESYHSKVERDAGPILDEIRNGNLAKLQNELARAVFSHFVGMQYCRTKKMFDRVCEGTDSLKDHPNNPGDIDSRRLTKIMAVINAESIANWIHSNTHMQFLKTNSNNPFITCDQPVYNIYGNQGRKEVTRLALFYPIAPTLSLLFWQRDHPRPEFSAEEYNHMTNANAYEFIFAKNRVEIDALNTQE